MEPKNTADQTKSSLADPSRLWTTIDVCYLLQVSASTLDVMIADGRIPAPFYLPGGRKRLWEPAAIGAWLEELTARQGQSVSPSSPSRRPTVSPRVHPKPSRKLGVPKRT